MRTKTATNSNKNQLKRLLIRAERGRGAQLDEPSLIFSKPAQRQQKRTPGCLNPRYRRGRHRHRRNHLHHRYSIATVISIVTITIAFSASCDHGVIVRAGIAAQWSVVSGYRTVRLTGLGVDTGRTAGRGRVAVTRDRSSTDTPSPGRPVG